MRSHRNTSLNLPHAPYRKKDGLRNIDREIKMGELRLRYVQLMRDAHLSLGNKDAIMLIKEAEAIWDKLNNPISLEN